MQKCLSTEKFTCLVSAMCQELSNCDTTNDFGPSDLDLRVLPTLENIKVCL